MKPDKNYDSEFCGSLPIHQINLVQDYGYLLLLEKTDLKVIQASENTEAVFGRPVRELIGTTADELFTGTDIEKIRKVLGDELGGRIPFNFALKENSPGTDGAGARSKDYHVLMHIKPEYLVLELEAVPVSEKRDFTDVFQEVRYIISSIDKASTVEEVCRTAIHELRRISGFDGILMYRFDEHWNGTVIAEEKDERLETYMGQTFPASDVPRQARELYLKNPYRLIPNREFEPVKLYPVINPLTHAFTDLSDCNLRSVAAVHLEYMKNMGIKASMSVRVIHEGRLWGLISCHHITAKYLDYETCSLFEWLSGVISDKISLILNKAGFELAGELQARRTALTDHIYATGNVAEALAGLDMEGLPDLFKAAGAAVVVNGRTSVIGNVPERDALDNLLLWLEGREVEQVYHTDNLPGIYEEAAQYAGVGSGLLVIPIDMRRGEMLICFRPEVVQDIHWGGDPNNAIQFDRDGKNYHPRNSFKLWKQTVRQHSLPWTHQELDVAASLRNFLFEFRMKQLYN
ncbi:GAF domain-containing protein [Pedobacter sp. JY14-1]|uniref:GAF domain-containing protein n=1 Tax=Pedobacter sp. JY14-1 TaxID=3034151 RepID=UPI0023E2DEBD|nr:GAF domain-containing protein [Pedobacter sp. JY14-1]